MSHGINLDGMSAAERLALAAELANKQTEDRATLISDVRTKVTQYVADAGLQMSDLFPKLFKAERSERAVKSVEPKYRNPENAEQTWTGRGKKPLWVQAVLARGESIEQYLIAA